MSIILYKGTAMLPLIFDFEFYLRIFMNLFLPEIDKTRTKLFQK